MKVRIKDIFIIIGIFLLIGTSFGSGFYIGRNFVYHPVYNYLEVTFPKMEKSNGTH